jgi:hypothetical protein
MRYKPKPAAATPAPEPPAPEEPAPEEPAPEEGTTLPDLSSPEPQQPEANAVVKNKLRPLMPLLQMAQVNVWPPLANCLDHKHHVLNVSWLAGTPQPPTDEATGTSRNPEDLLVPGSGYQNIITTDLVDDPLLIVSNMRYFQKISKEMYQYTVVRHDYSSTVILCWVACLNPSPYAGCGQTLTMKVRKAESSREWPSGT